MRSGGISRVRAAIRALCGLAAVLMHVQACAGAESTPPPARIVTRYALVTSPDPAAHDPQSWRLLGSNDGGRTWTQLDRRTNQQFSGRTQRRDFRVPYPAAFNVYRLLIDESRSPMEVYTDREGSVELAEVELMGPLVGGIRENELKLLISASQPHPLLGPAADAFDNDLMSRWFDFGLGRSNGCWIQCQFARTAEPVVTSVSQLQILTWRSAARDWVGLRGPRILSNLTTHVSSPARVLIGYALGSANDVPARDPRDWRLLGSHDRGRHWQVLDARRDEVFPERFQRRVFAVTNRTAYALYRLEITSVRTPGNMVQLGEIEPLYARTPAESDVSLVVLGSAENPPMESVAAAFDNDAKTKWVSFDDPTPNQPAWVQWQFVAREPDLPLINQRDMDRLASRQLLEHLNASTPPARILRAYALTSANDSPERDPLNWELLGSNDGGRSWQTLDTRSQERFSNRFERRLFVLTNSTPFATYRLRWDSVADPAHANSIQLAEIEPVFAGPAPVPPLTVLISVQGDNPRRETADKVFDGIVQTKWLDFADGNTNRSSWIQWQYAAGLEQRVIHLGQLRAAQPRPAERVLLQLDGVAVGVKSEANLVGLLDPTGFEWIELESGAPTVRPGEPVRLAGELEFGRLVAKVLRPEVTALPALLSLPLLRPGAAFPEAGTFASGVVEGMATSLAEHPSFSTIHLTDTNGPTPLLVRVLSPRRLPLPASLNCRLRARGVIEPAYTTGNRRVAGILWASSLDALSLAPPTESEWRQWPEFAVERLVQTSSPPARLVRVPGTLGEQSPGRLVLRDGARELIVHLAEPVALPTGSRIEAAGFCMIENSRPTLRLAAVRPLPTATAQSDSGPPSGSAMPITAVHQVLALMKSPPGEEVPFSVRGVITYIDLGLGDFYLQDGGDSLQVRGQGRAGLSPFLRQEGAWVELEGVLHQGLPYATNFVRMLGHGHMPEPVRHSWDQMMSGMDDGRWVQVEGIVRTAQKQRLALSVAGGLFSIWLKDLDKDLQARLLGSLVRVSGVCTPVLNTRDQRMGLRLLVPSGEEVQIIDAAPEDPFSLATLPLGRVLTGANPAGSSTPIVKTAGVVTHKAGNQLFLQDGSEGLRVLLREESNVAPGDCVEAAGLAEPDGFSPQLVQAVVRSVGHTNLPPASPIELLDEEGNRQEEIRDATRGRIDATLLGVSAGDSLLVLELRENKNQLTFRAFLPRLSQSLPSLRPGSRVALEGVFKAKSAATLELERTAPSFEMYLNSLADVAVLEMGPWWTTRHTWWTLGGFGLVLFVSLGWSALLRNQVRLRTAQLHAEIDEHKRTEAQLEAEITERKRMQGEIERTHQELVAASRRAGMAEVATGVLHNVGNVLNSVNVSATLVRDRLKQSRLPKLAKAAQLLSEHAADLGHFLSADPQGRHLPGYFNQLAHRLAEEQASTLTELNHLHEHVEHIRDIVASQQNYAKASGVAERVQMRELVEQALRMNQTVLAQHKLQVLREYPSHLPEITVDRHKVLQILINLIHNGVHACVQSGRADRQLVIRLAVDQTLLRLSFIDNGVGIAPENLTRIFSHGYTTRKDGHGFGLHSGALAAAEMGGALLAHSDGPGTGATFTLELPL